MTQVFQIDEKGYYVKPVDIIGGGDIPDNCVEVRPPNGLYKAKWDESNWVEGMSHEEIEELRNKFREPSFRELQLEYNVDLDYRISLIEMGLM